MTNEKIKRKIIKILNYATSTWFDDDHDWEGDPQERAEGFKAHVADALIAAGIGDVSDLEVKCEVLQRDVDNLTRTLEEGREEFEEAKCRAEATEKALLIVVKKALELSHRAQIAEKALKKAVSVLDSEYRAFGVNKENKTEQRIKKFIEQAEKELAEENSNGKG